MKELNLSNKHNHRSHKCQAKRGPSFAEIRVHYINAGYTPEQIYSVPYQDLGMNMTDDEINASHFSDEDLKQWLAGEHEAQKRGA